MESSPLVRINFDDAERIASLYDISQKTAERIVEYRGTYGPLRGPEDLAQVEGVSAALALTLSPHIQWDTEQYPFFSRRVINLVFAFTVILETLSTVFFYRNQVLHDIRIFSSQFPGLSLGDRLSFIIFFSILFLFLIGVILAALYIGLYAESLSLQKAFFLIWLSTIGYPVLFLSANLFLGDISQRLGLLSLQVFWASNRFGTGGNIVYLGFLILLILAFLPGFREYLGDHPRAARAYDLVMIGSFMAAMILYTVFRILTEISLITAVQVIMAVILLIALLALIRSAAGDTILTLTGFFLDEQDQEQQGWMTWANIHLPNREDQKALKQALDSAFPRSWFASIFQLVIVSLGGWLLLTVSGAIVEWVTQSTLEEILEWLGV